MAKTQSVWVFFYVDDQGQEVIPMIGLAGGAEVPAIALDEQRATALQATFAMLPFGRKVSMVRFDERIDMGEVATAPLRTTLM